MNRTIISIEVQDNGDKEATIIVKGERNKQILFEEQFIYKDEEKHPLRLHLLKERFMQKDYAEGKSLGVMSIRKLFKDITERSKSVGVPDYRDAEKQNIREVLTRLHEISRELNKPFDSGDVIVEYSQRYGTLSAEISKTAIHPIYYPPECSVTIED